MFRARSARLYAFVCLLGRHWELSNGVSTVVRYTEGVWSHRPLAAGGERDYCMGCEMGRAPRRAVLGLQIVKLHDIIGSFAGCASISLPDCVEEMRTGKPRLWSWDRAAWSCLAIIRDALPCSVAVACRCLEVVLDLCKPVHERGREKKRKRGNEEDEWGEKKRGRRMGQKKGEQVEVMESGMVAPDRLPYPSVLHGGPSLAYLGRRGTSHLSRGCASSSARCSAWR